MKAQPMIDAVQSILASQNLHADQTNRAIFFMSPSNIVFNQTLAYEYATHYEHIIFVSGRYEGIDHRFEQYMTQHYPQQFKKISLGAFVTL